MNTKNILIITVFAALMQISVYALKRSVHRNAIVDYVQIDRARIVSPYNMTSTCTDDYEERNTDEVSILTKDSKKSDCKNGNRITQTGNNG